MNQPARLDTAAVPALREQHVHRIAAAAEASHSPATLRNYRAAWSRFVQWCGREGLDALPAAPESVAAYLAERAEARSLATVRLDRFAIRWAHEQAGHPSPAGRTESRGCGVGRRVLRTLAPGRNGRRSGARRNPDRRRPERRKVGQRSHARVLHPGHDPGTGKRLEDVDLLLPKLFLDPPHCAPDEGEQSALVTEVGDDLPG